jgi:hypothetical protein
MDLIVERSLEYERAVTCWGKWGLEWHPVGKRVSYSHDSGGSIPQPQAL